MKLEVVTTNLTDVKDAEKYGADRAELITAMTELGLTPSYGLIKEAVRSVDIPVNVIVRPHNQSFYYNDNDVQTMITDIKMIKDLGANGIVIGPLAADGTFDKEVLERLLEVSVGLDVTIHRAIDFARDQVEAIKFLKEYKEITTILTAGGNYNAPEAVDQVNELIDLAKDSHVKMMIGNGLKLDNVEEFLQKVKPVDALHFGSDVRINKSVMNPLDGERIKAIKKIMSSRKPPIN